MLFCKSAHVMIEKCRLVQEAGVKPQVTFYTSADVDNANRYLIRSGLLEKPYNFLLLFGLPGTSPMDSSRAMMETLLNTYNQLKDIDPDCRISVLVCFDLLTTKLPPKRKVLLEIFNNSACLVFSIFILILSIRKIMMPSMHNQISVNTGLAIFIPYLSIPIGMAFIVLFSINNYGELINRLKTAFKRQIGGGVTKRLLNFIRELIGWVRGGLAYSTVVISAILSAILGSPNGVCSMLCGVLIPELRKDKYPDEYSGALISSASILGPIIPPSVQFVMFCMMTNVSIKTMFISGIVPGICLVIMFCGLVYYKTRKFKFQKTIDRISGRNLVRAFVVAIPALIVPIVIIGGIIGGVFTATEAGAVSCICAIIAGLIYCELKWKDLPAALVRAAIVGGGILLMISFGGIIAWSLSMSGIPQQLVAFVTSLTQSKELIILIMAVILLIGGAFADTGSMTMIFVPVLYPLAIFSYTIACVFA
jgi:tripartite ATP-independent transporter DctM subunit